MPEFEVTISRTESITFVIDAKDQQDAEDRYLMDGDETGSKTTELTILSTTPVEADPAVVAAGTLSGAALVEAATEARALND